MKDKSSINSLRITSALAIIAGSWAMLFEIYFFKAFYFEIYFARVALTLIATVTFFLSYQKNISKYSTIVIHILILSIISSFLITLYVIPDTVFINSQLLSLLVFTIAIIFGWDAKHQVIVAIYYNVLFAVTIFSVDETIFRLPNIFSLVLFVSFISLLSVGASSVIYSMRVKFNERNEEIKFLFSNAPIGICKLDMQGKPVTANGYFYNLLSVNGKTDESIEKFIAVLKTKGIINNTLERSNYKWTNFQFELDGKELFLNISTKLLKTNKNRQFIELIVWDETDVKLAERARNHALKRLAEESEKREKVTLKAIEQKNQKIGLLAKINHEVRTPLNSILSFFDMVENNMLKSDAELRDFGSSVKISADSLLQTINNFIDFAKIETGHMKLEEEFFNLTEVVESVESLLKPLAASKKNQLLIDTMGIKYNVIKTDEGKFRQIIINLIGNANKFTSSGIIKLEISTDLSNTDTYCLRAVVKDNGIGIDESKIANIFKPFESGGSLKEQEYSSGLGLAICNEFTEMLKGTIELTSEKGKGTRVETKIPIKIRT